MIDKHSDTWIVIDALLSKHEGVSTKTIRNYLADERVSDFHRGRLSMIAEMRKEAAREV